MPKVTRAAIRKLKALAAAAGFACTAGLSVWGVYALPEYLVDRILEEHLQRQAVLWNRAVLEHLEDGTNTFNTRVLDEHDVEYLSLLPRSSDVYRLKLYTADGEIFWSTRTSDIGDQIRTPYFQSVVAQGVIYYNHSQKPATQVDGYTPLSTDSGAIEERHVAELYKPVMENGTFVGAMEFYSDLTDMRETFLWRARLALSVIAALALGAMGVVSFAVMRANRFSLRQMEARSAEDQELMANQLQLAREVQLLGELNEWLQSSRSLDELFNMVSEFMRHLLPDAEGSIYVFSNSRDVLDGCASWNGGSHKDHIHPEECWGLRRGRTYQYGAAEVEFVCAHAEPHDGRPYFCFPILAHGETVGLMHLRALPSRAADFATCKKLAQMCAEQISMAIANVRMRDQLHDQSVRDPLTGLFNRRHMTETLRKCLNSSLGLGKPLSVIGIDVDHFKKFNDNHGHDAGDMVLRAVAAVLDKACDGDQAACRPGGEEFTLILPGLSQDEAAAKAEEVREAVEAVSIRYGEKTLPHVTISLGVAHFPQHGSLPQDLLRAADEALYAAKAKGRNQVCVAETDPAADGGSGDAAGPVPAAPKDADMKELPAPGSKIAAE